MFLTANHLEIHLVISSLRKGRQQELQARLMEADRNRDELQRVREELQMYLQCQMCQVEKGDLFHVVHEIDKAFYDLAHYQFWETLSLIDGTQKMGVTRKSLTSTLSYVHMPTLWKTAIYGNNPGHTDLKWTADVLESTVALLRGAAPTSLGRSSSYRLRQQSFNSNRML